MDSGFLPAASSPKVVDNTKVLSRGIPKSGRPPLSKEEGAPTPPMTSVHPEAPDSLLEALQGASIVDKHHSLMGMVIERIQSAKSGLPKRARAF